LPIHNSRRFGISNLSATCNFTLLPILRNSVRFMKHV
jgi:hypothetical protein